MFYFCFVQQLYSIQVFGMQDVAFKSLSLIVFNTIKSICVQNMRSSVKAPNQVWLCKVKHDVLFMQLCPQSPRSPYVHFQGYARLCWGVLFHHLSYFTLLVPCRRCSVSTFSCGWLTAHTPLSLFAKSLLSSNTLPLSESPESLDTPLPASLSQSDSPRAPPQCIQLLKNNRCSRVYRGRAVWWEQCPNRLLTVIRPPLPANVQLVTPADPSPYLWTPSHLCLLSLSLYMLNLCHN